MCSCLVRCYCVLSQCVASASVVVKCLNVLHLLRICVEDRTLQLIFIVIVVVHHVVVHHVVVVNRHVVVYHHVVVVHHVVVHHVVVHHHVVLAIFTVFCSH